MSGWYHKNMNPLTYLHLQLRLEGKTLVNKQFMRQVEVVPGEEMPLILIAQLANEKWVAYYDETMSPDLHDEIVTNLLEIKFPKIDSLLNVLESHSIQFEVGHYKTYVFPPQLPSHVETIFFSKHNPKVKAFGFDGFAENVYAIERDGHIVSACVSTRENDRCGEAWVYTDVAYRNQGFAQKVVNSWAGNLMDAGKVPFYSHNIENAASANLARKLGLQPVFEEIVITQI
jgi:RimJ/RimL family protein N-acetyltransferase